jgi:hypothetical protein
MTSEAKASRRRQYQWIVVASKTASGSSEFDRGSECQRVMNRRQRNHGETVVLALQHESNRMGNRWSVKP